MFMNALEPFNPKKSIVIQLGEVDCGFVIWYRAEKYGETVEKQFVQSLNAYEEFVEKLLSLGYRKIVLTSAILPTILDGQDWGEVANARTEVKASLHQRTDLTIEYNKNLRFIAESLGIRFVDLTDEVINPQTMLVKDTFLNPNTTDHHLDPEKIGPLWASSLERLGM